MRSYATAPDADLAAWSAEGDRRAFDEIVIRHGPFALRVALRLVPDRAAAEDLAQDAMVKAWRQVSRYDPERARFSTWLYRIVVNLCIDHGRRDQPVRLPEDFDPPDPATAIDEAIEADERDRALAEALRALPERQKAAVTLVYDEGLSGGEAAKAMGLTAKAVERLLARARAQLRRHLLPERNEERRDVEL